MEPFYCDDTIGHRLTRPSLAELRNPQIDSQKLSERKELLEQMSKEIESDKGGPVSNIFCHVFFVQNYNFI